MRLDRLLASARLGIGVKNHIFYGQIVKGLKRAVFYRNGVSHFLGCHGGMLSLRLFCWSIFFGVAVICRS